MSDTLPPPPEGFAELPEGLGFTDVLRPIYRSERENHVAMGMWVQDKHTNMIGICHGGVLMTLSDVAASWGLNQRREKLTGAPTLNLSFDFISAAKEGDWLQAEADRVELKKRFGFSSGVVTTGEGKLVCRFSGSFYFPDHDHYDKKLDVLRRVRGIGASD
jgi:uncharacterized protein (TIGR00369 family)